MRWHKIYGILLRHYYISLRSLDRMTEIFYWPIIDLFTWGITTLYFKSYTTQSAHIVLVILSGLMFWNLAWRGQQEITTNLLEEYWNRNLINIFVAPIKFSEWVVAIMIVSLVKSGMSFIFVSIIAAWLYKVNVLMYGFYLIPFVFLLLMTSWIFGFALSGLVLRLGSKVQALTYAVLAAFTPFSAVFFSIAILPDWAQKIAFFVPASYIFEGIRQIIQTGTMDITKLYMSLFLSSIYLFLALVYVRRSFNKVLEKGLVKAQ